jgi:hypothetical protein
LYSKIGGENIMEPKLPVTIRTRTVIKSIDRIESLIDELLEGEKKEGAMQAIHLIRKELNLPIEKRK